MNTSIQLSDHSREILVRAQQEANQLNHDYVGTEHILLALLQERGGVAASTLMALGLSADAVRGEIAEIVCPGPVHEAMPRELPLTPRARMSLDYARGEARQVAQKVVSPEHLLLGLCREPDGVAGQVVRNLGVSTQSLRAEALRIRLALMTIVERAVRPVRASMTRKMKMREEMLAHVAAIHEEESGRPSDAMSAIERTSRRFGDPAELSRKLESAVPWRERILADRLGWRPPESAARYTLRTAMQLFAIIGPIAAALVIACIAAGGWYRGYWQVIRLTAGLTALIPADVFLLGVLYFGMRDALLGAPWARKSTPRVAAFCALIALVTLGSALAPLGLADWDLGRAIDLLFPYGAAAVFVAGVSIAHAHISGPTEVSHTVWSCLKID